MADEPSKSQQLGVLVNASYVESKQAYFIKTDDDQEPDFAAKQSRRCLIEYLDEGGANFVFTLKPIDRTLSNSPSRLHRKLLRLPKNLPHVLPADRQLSTFHQTFGALFPPTHLVLADLIHLTQPTITNLNHHLTLLPRPSRRATDVLPSAPMTGFLITDMTASHPSESLIQLKPKWLYQSLNAPASSRRCRTCALRAQRTASRERTSSDAQEICPLALVHAEEGIRGAAFAALTGDEELCAYLVTEAQPLLRRLRECQMGFDRVGVLGARGEMEVAELCKAMTLRDCTLYVRRTRVGAGGGGGEEGSTVEARLGDLDLKLPARLEHWKRIERGLIDDGWYTNEENSAVHTPEKICTLSMGAA
jgi:inositol-pentakisphosphate 2-kinase